MIRLVERRIVLHVQAGDSNGQSSNRCFFKPRRVEQVLANRA